jgi:hypothetical protein
MQYIPEKTMVIVICLLLDFHALLTLAPLRFLYIFLFSYIYIYIYIYMIMTYTGIRRYFLDIHEVGDYKKKIPPNILKDFK